MALLDTDVAQSCAYSMSGVARSGPKWPVYHSRAAVVSRYAAHPKQPRRTISPLSHVSAMRQRDVTPPARYWRSEQSLCKSSPSPRPACYPLSASPKNRSALCSIRLDRGGSNFLKTSVGTNMAHASPRWKPLLKGSIEDGLRKGDAGIR